MKSFSVKWRKRFFNLTMLFFVSVQFTPVHAQNDFLNKADWSQKNVRNNQQVSPEAINKLKKQKAFWYADKAFSEKEPVHKSQPFEQKQWVKTLFWILIVGSFLAFLITYLIKSNIRLFSKKDVLLTGVDIEEMPTDIFSINYEQAIRSAVNQKDFRLAIRFMYLQSLKELNDKKLIVYKPEKTNFDYLSDLYNSKLYNSFFTITRNYEYTWYGKFDISEPVFHSIETDFSSFKNEINHR